MVQANNDLGRWNVVHRSLTGVEQLGEIELGMSKAEVRNICGDLLKCHDEQCEVRDQHLLITPGFYPYFDARQVFLTFDGELLREISQQGKYNVYW